MIPRYSDHAANERTFLAWVRTGLAVIAFGFLVERVNKFMVAIVENSTGETRRALLSQRVMTPLGRYDGLALIVVGIVLIMVAAIRYVRTARYIDAPEPRVAMGVRAEMAISAVLALLAVAFSIYLVLE
jgi:putative membrane protein